MTKNYLYKSVHSDIVANIWRSLLWMNVWSSFSLKLLRLAFPKWQALHGAHYLYSPGPSDYLPWKVPAGWEHQSFWWPHFTLFEPGNLPQPLEKPPESVKTRKEGFQQDSEWRLSLWYFGHLTWCHKVRSPKLRLLLPSAGCSVHRSAGHMLTFVRGWLSHDKLQEDTLCGSIHPSSQTAYFVNMWQH